jgi:hypothetical protein
MQNKQLEQKYHHMMSFHLADANLNFFPKKNNGTQSRMAQKAIAAKVP